MSLREKFTWHDFLERQGDNAKDLKRTSPEGQKAFETAQKEHMKAVVDARVKQWQADKKQAEKTISELQGMMKGLKSEAKRKAIQKRIARRQHAVQDLEQAIQRDQARSL